MRTFIPIYLYLAFPASHYDIACCHLTCTLGDVSTSIHCNVTLGAVLVFRVSDSYNAWYESGWIIKSPYCTPIKWGPFKSLLILRWPWYLLQQACRWQHSNEHILDADNTSQQWNCHKEHFGCSPWNMTSWSQIWNQNLFITSVCF